MNSLPAAGLFFLLPAGALALENFLLFLLSLAAVILQRRSGGVATTEAGDGGRAGWKMRVQLTVFTSLSCLLHAPVLLAAAALWLGIPGLWYPFIILTRYSCALCRAPLWAKSAGRGRVRAVRHEVEGVLHRV